MLTTASQFGPRARSLRTNHAATTATVHRVLGAPGAITAQQYQQTRDFRFGSWFSHLDSEVQEEFRRRQQAFKQKYAEQLNRRLNWDKHPLADDARHAVKRMMASYWLTHDAHPCGRRDDAGTRKQRTEDNKDGMRPGQNIEDVERGAMEHLIFGKGEEGPAPGPKSKRKRGVGKSKHYSVPHTSYGIPQHDDYFIDPVTNRKVAKHQAPGSHEDGVDIPVKKFKDYRSPFTSIDGVLNDAPAAEEFRMHTRVEIDANAEHTEEALGPSGEPQPTTHNDVAEAQDSKLGYDDLHKYKPVIDKEPVRFEDLKPPYEDLDKYNSAVIDEVIAHFESERAPYSDLHRYDPVFDTEGLSKEESELKHNDFDKHNTGFPDDTIAKQTEDFPTHEDLDESGPFERHGKPMGHQIHSVKEGLPLNYQPLVENLEPGDFPPFTVKQLREKYGTAELRKYTAVRHLETQGNSSSTEERVAEEANKIYDSEEAAEYKPVYYNEPDGNPVPTADERAVEDLTKRYDPEELAKYTPVYWNEPDGQPAAATDSRVAEGLTKDYDPAELAEYKPVYWNEPDGQPLTSMDERAAEGLTKNYDPVELDDYERHVQWNEPDGQPPQAAEELSKKHTDLDQYGPIGYQELDRHPSVQADAVRDGLEDMDARRDYESANRLASEELDRADEPSAEVLRRMGKSQQIDGEYKESKRRQMLEQQMKKYQTASDATDYEASLAVKSARARAANAECKRQLTGNYVRDFPEEFDKSWTETLSAAPTETAHPSDEFVFESQNMDGGLEGAFGRPSPAKIQPALDRLLDDQPLKTNTSRALETEDSNSNAGQDLSTLHASESGGIPTSPAHVKQREEVSALADKGSAGTTPGTIRHDSMSGPTLYKILAYDPTMQKIEVAETSSYVPDTASALTPADALLRLSHPTRFFPHFAPLQAEGYEIISGTGDVLVFRKVRPETSNGKTAGQAQVTDQSAPKADESRAVETRINPIDMTGRARFSPVSANFASPTGYVTYDNIPETAAGKLPPPPPKIKYNIDVHREEPVFSGPKTRISDGQRGKKKSLGKRLVVGGVWVAGISYALGVIAEYFTTGGVDGMGPTGL
ncbi:putative conserved serine-threonine rich protein [Diaporthe ampelina]|uniref:Putative conserved serine-threonine rich protein n=1 Tax=Diaporthe ampelina TaxID=1214573 RepID=A0A0G2FVP1_9PEZI|nr:putative conserved serine-threonine rich protein [Diaporthe ampelina]